MRRSATESGAPLTTFRGVAAATLFNAPLRAGRLSGLGRANPREVASWVTGAEFHHRDKAGPLYSGSNGAEKGSANFRALFCIRHTDKLVSGIAQRVLVIHVGEVVD